MAKRNSGWYTFADGFHAWCAGMSAQEKRRAVATHGKIVKFEPTN